MIARRPQSTDQVGTLSKAGRIMSAPFGRRDIHGRMLLCEIAVGQHRREFEYRIKSASEEHERVALESELTKA